MPALITHHLFGEESILRLPAGIAATEEERAAFLIANQGPDPFFFRFRSCQAPSCMQLARVMHRSFISRQFAVLRDGVERLPQAEAGIGRAFVLGLLSHYVLDRTAHPFVYAQQWGIQEQDPDLAAAGSKVHAVIEADLDVYMLLNKRYGATVAQYPPVDELQTTPRIDRAAGALLSSMAHIVYGLGVGAAEYGGAVADMRLVYRTIEPQGSLPGSLLAALESLGGGYSLVGSLTHRVTSTPPRAAANEDGLTWKNPFTHATSRATFLEVFNQALEDYEHSAALFVAGSQMSEVTHRINYSGRPLAVDEVFDREE